MLFQDVHYVELDADSVLTEAPPDGYYAVIRHGVRSPFATPFGDPFAWMIQLFFFEGGVCDSIGFASNPIDCISGRPYKFNRIYIVDVPEQERRELFEAGKKKGVRFLPAP